MIGHALVYTDMIIPLIIVTIDKLEILLKLKFNKNQTIPHITLKDVIEMTVVSNIFIHPISDAAIIMRVIMIIKIAAIPILATILPIVSMMLDFLTIFS